MRLPPFRLLIPATLTLLLAGCAAENAYRAGNELVAEDKIEAGLLKYREALAADPSNPVYKLAYLRARDGATNRLLTQADRELAESKAEQARQDYQRVMAIDPVNDRARAGLRQVETDNRLEAMLADALALAGRKDFDGAHQTLEAILTERPSYEPARRLLAEVNNKSSPAPAQQVLATAFRTPISLEFHDAPLKQVFEVIARHSGLNFLFDKDVKADQHTSIFLKNSTVEASIYFLLMTNQLALEVMDGNTILIYPNVAAKHKDYQQLLVKTFYLANAEAKNVANTLRTILKSRDLVVDEKLNLIILRDSPEAVKLAARLVALQDVPEPEVMLDVEVLEVQRNRLLDLGIDWPTSLQFAPLQNASGTSVTIDQLRRLNATTIGITGVSGAITVSKTNGDTNTLAAPRIRVRNHEKAKVVIGDKLPTITTTISSGVGGFASESVNYVDVGLKLEAEPTIYLNNEVAIRISLEVSKLVDTITTKSGTTAYRIGTRSATTMLQLKDGENQVLAGLIQNDDRSSGTRLPGLGDLPVLGRLFGSRQDTDDRSEVVLSITPHLVRNIQRPPASSSEFGAGTDAGFQRPPSTTVPAPVQQVQARTISTTQLVPPPPQPQVPLQPPAQTQGQGGMMAPAIGVDMGDAPPAPSAVQAIPVPVPSTTATVAPPPAQQP